MRNGSSPGRFIGAEKPATCDTALSQVGHFQSLRPESTPSSLFCSILLMHTLQNWWSQGRILDMGEYEEVGLEGGDVHAITEPKLASRAHLRFRRVKLWFSADADVFVHLADALHVVEVTSIKAFVYLLFNNKVLAASLSVCFDVGGRRMRNDMRHPFAAYWVEDMDMQNARRGVVPCRGWVGIFVYVLNCVAC